MCNFLSGITFGPRLEKRFGRYYSTPDKTDSHTEMERALELPVTKDSEWAKWEYTPTGWRLDFDNYRFVIDEARKPDWWTDEIEAETIRYAKNTLQNYLDPKYDKDGRLTSVGGYLYCEGYTGDLFALTSVGGPLYCRGYTGDLSALTSVGGSFYCEGYTGDLSKLKKVNGRVWKDTRKAVSK